MEELRQSEDRFRLMADIAPVMIWIRWARAESEGSGRGASFTVGLPLAGAAAPDGAPEPVPAVAGPLRVLIIEDNRDAAESLQMLLEIEGHTVTVAHTGPDGLAAARASQPDVVLCDLGLPGMSGYDVAAALKQEPWRPHTSVIAVTAFGDAADRTRSREAGFDAHLVKPVDLEDLRRLLAERRTIDDRR